MPEALRVGVVCADEDEPCFEFEAEPLSAEDALVTLELDEGRATQTRTIPDVLATPSEVVERVMVFRCDEVVLLDVRVVGGGGGLL